MLYKFLLTNIMSCHMYKETTPDSIYFGSCLLNILWNKNGYVAIYHGNKTPNFRCMLKFFFMTNMHIFYKNIYYINFFCCKTFFNLLYTLVKLAMILTCNQLATFWSRDFLYTSTRKPETLAKPGCHSFKFYCFKRLAIFLNIYTIIHNDKITWSC